VAAKSVIHKIRIIEAISILVARAARNNISVHLQRRIRRRAPEGRLIVKRLRERAPASPGQESAACAKARATIKRAVQRKAKLERCLRADGALVWISNDELMSPWRPDHFAAVGRVSQGFVQVRIVKNLPEPIYGLPISLRMIGCHPLDRSQCKHEKCVAAALQGGPDRLRTDELAESHHGRGISKIMRRG